MSAVILPGDCRDTLKTLPANSVHCVVTSPPYFGLRDYGTSGQIGLEPTPAVFVQALVEVFREVKRVLRSDGVAWLNLGDSYGKTGLCGIPWRVAFALQEDGWHLRSDVIWEKPNGLPESVENRPTKSHEYVFLLAKSARYFYDWYAIKEPHVTFSNDSKMRGGRGHIGVRGGTPEKGKNSGNPNLHNGRWDNAFRPGGRNRRTVWRINTIPFSAAQYGIKDADHFAAFPEELARLCILSGTSEKGCCSACGEPWEREVVKEGETTTAKRKELVSSVKRGLEGVKITQNLDYAGGHRSNSRASYTKGWKPTCACQADLAPCTVLDPFLGTGTSAAVAVRYGRNAIGCELNPAYIEIAQARVGAEAGIFAGPSPVSVAEPEPEEPAFTQQEMFA